MCLAVPMLVREIRGTQAEVEVGGVGRTVSLLLTPDAKVGDYVLVHTGFAIGTIDESEAKITLELLAQIGESYERDAEEEIAGP